jgi:Tfp pilus assembly protein PilX
MSKIFKPSKGSILVVTLVITELFLVLTLGSISLILLEQRLYISKIAKEQALQIAEAGVNYYRWVLYHDHDEYCKGLAPCNTAPYTEGPFQFTAV